MERHVMTTTAAAEDDADGARAVSTQSAAFPNGSTANFDDLVGNIDMSARSKASYIYHVSKERSKEDVVAEVRRFMARSDVLPTQTHSVGLHTVSRTASPVL